MSQKVLKVSTIPYIDFEETLVATVADIPVLPEQLYGYLPAPVPLPNVALGKSVAASSSSGGITPNPAYQGNDGSLSTAWYSEYTDGWPRWWSVDLGAAYRILSFELVLEGGSNNLKSFEVQHSADNATWTTIYSITNNPVGAAGTYIDVTLAPPVSDRYWRVLIHENNGDTYSRITEARFYGYVPVPLAPQKGDLAGDTTTTEVVAIGGVPIDATTAPDGTNTTFTFDPGSGHIKWLPGGTGGGPGGLTGPAPSVRAYNTADTTVPANTWTVIGLDSEAWDSDNFHDPATNPSRLTVPADLAGLYVVTASFRFDGSFAGFKYIAIRKNGSEFLAREAFDSMGHFSLAALVELAAGDYLELMAFQTSTGSQVVNGTTAFSGSPEAMYLAMALLTRGSGGATYVGASLHHSADQVIPDGTPTFLTWDTELFDEGNFHDPALPTRLTVPATQAGKYLVHAQIHWDGSSAGQRSLHLIKNGTDFVASSNLIPGGIELIQEVNNVIELVAGDYIEVQVYGNSGSHTVLGSASLGGPFFSISSLNGGTARPSAARVTISAPQSVPLSGGFLSFDREDYDTDGYHSLVTNPTRLTVPAGKAGLYSITANIRFQDATTVYYRLGPQIFLNGTFLAGLETGQVSNDPYPQYTASTDYMLAEGDYIELKAYYTADTARTITSAALMLHQVLGSGGGGGGGTGLTPLTPDPTGSYNFGDVNQFGQVTTPQNVDVAGTAVGGDVSGTVGAISVPNKGTAGTYAYPSSVTTDAKGDVTALTAGSAPVTAVTASGSPLASSGGTTPAISWNPTAAVPFNKQQLQAAAFDNQATAPGTPVSGQVYLDTASSKVRAFIASAWQDFITSATAVGGDVSGTVGSILLPVKGSPGTYAYPSQIITDAKGAVTGITAGSAPVTGVSTTGPIGNSGSSLAPNITWNPAAAFSNNGQPVSNFVIESLAVAPTGAAGRIYSDTALNKLRAYLNATWQSLVTDATALAGDVTGTIGATVLPAKGTAGTYAFPASITTDAKGDVTAITAGNAQVDLQASSPGTAQTGSARVTGSLGADTRFYLGSIPFVERGTAFPASPVDGQRYKHETYRSWFTYYAGTENKWRQESPGHFDGAFPTVSSGDNTAAPKIEVVRLDLNNRVYFYNGAVWLPRAGTRVTLDKVCRVYDTTTTFTSGAPINVQVTGVLDLTTGWLTLPSTLFSVVYSFFVLTAAATGVGVVVENPDHTAGASTMRGTTAQQSAGGNFAYSGGGVVSLSSTGQLRFVYSGTAAATRIIVDIWEYML